MTTWRQKLPKARARLGVCVKSTADPGTGAKDARYLDRDAAVLALLAAGVTPQALDGLEAAAVEVLGQETVRVGQTSYRLASATDAATLRDYLKRAATGPLFPAERGGAALGASAVRRLVSRWAS